MIKPIVRDILFLGQKSEDATKSDMQIVEDLIDTLRANFENCVGLAGNMIGAKKRVLVFSVDSLIVPMINPVMIRKEQPYDAEESCLSLIGVRKTIRYDLIEVEYLDKDFVKKKEVFTGFTAQIIQHEMDHFEGIII